MTLNTFQLGLPCVVHFEHGVSRGYGNSVAEAVEWATDYMRELLGPRFHELGSVVRVTREEHGTIFVLYIRGADV